MSKRNQDLGLVLSGGGARGAFTAGVLERIGSDPRFREPRVVAGTSAGALNAALFAAGKSGPEIHAFWLALARLQPARTNTTFFIQAARAFAELSLSRPLATAAALIRHRAPGLPLLPGRALASLIEVLLTERYDLITAFLNKVKESYLVETSGIRAQLVETLGSEVVPERRCRLAINATDARTNNAVRFVSERSEATASEEYVVGNITVDMVISSISIPILFPSVSIEGRLLWDGGVLNNTPLAPAVTLGARRIVTVLSSGLNRYGAPNFLSLGAALERLSEALLENAYNVDRKLLLSRNEIGALGAARAGKPYHQVELYEAIRPGSDALFDAGSYLNFERSRVERMYQHGQSAATAWLRAGPRLDAADARRQAA